MGCEKRPGPSSGSTAPFPATPSNTPGNVLGLISQARLPRFESPLDYEERFSGDRFGVLARCQADEKDELTRFFEENGAEIKTADG